MSESTYCSPSSLELQIETYMKAVIFPLIPIQEHIWNSFSTHTSPYHINLLALLPYSAISIFGRDFKAHKEKYFLHCKPDLAQSMSYRREDSSSIETTWQNIISLGFLCYLRLTLDMCCIKWTTKEKKKSALAACSSWIFRYFLQQPSASLQREGSCAVLLPQYGQRECKLIYELINASDFCNEIIDSI